MYSYRKKKKHRLLRFLIILIILLLALGIIAVGFSLLNNARVVLDKQSLTLPQLSGNLNILHISDLHGQVFGEEQSRLALAWQGTSSVGVVCITGDMTAADGNGTAFCDLLEKLPNANYVFFIAGDEDPDPILYTPHDGDSVYAGWVREAMDCGATYLDCPMDVKYNGTVIWFCPEDAMDMDVAATRRQLTERREQ